MPYVSIRPEAHEPAAFDVKAMVARYGVSRSFLYNEINEGRLRRTKVGSRALIDRADADAWWQACRAGSGR